MSHAVPFVRSLVLSCSAGALLAQGGPWQQVPLVSAPPARADMALAHDDANDRLVLFGGDTFSPSGDTWSWDGVAWSPLQTVTSPTARLGHAMAYDAARQQVILFGGFDGGSSLGDTWAWDGVDWQQLTPAVSPPARRDHRLAYDASSQRIVLYGGRTDTVTGLADTWAWDGTVWSPVFSPAFPPARHSHGMAYDASRQRIVVFGGRSWLGSVTDDTWEWNGSNWQQLAPATAPIPRQGVGMAYDPSTQRVVLYGGTDVAGFGPFADTWEWDGSNWQLQTNPAPPIARDGMGMAWDAGRQRLLMYGGRNGTTLRSDTWVNGSPPVVASATQYGAGCGSPPMQLVPDLTAPPVLGTSASAAVLDAPTLATAATIGFDDTFFGPFLIPVPLNSVGMPGCSLWHSSELIGLATNLVGGSQPVVTVALPAQASLLGSHLYLQTFAFAPGENPLQIVISNGLDWQLGNFAVAPHLQLNENFLDESGRDPSQSGGTWGGASGPGARPGNVGGDGRHGSFDVTLGTALPGDVYEWNTDNFVIPASASTTGQQYVVTDGQFFFTDMMLPAGTTLRFVGSNAPVVRVRGEVDIQGVIDLSGVDAATQSPPSGVAFNERISTFNARNAGLQTQGQPGTLGGPMGGRGGTGGLECLNAGPIIVGGENLTDGADGDGVQVAAGHAYAANATGSGGRGGAMTPASGIWANPTPKVGNVYCAYFSTGGSGGGFWTAGGPAGPAVHANTFYTVVSEPVATGGSAFDLMPFPPASPPPGYTSLTHFLVGGAGGGGGASHGYGLLAVVSSPSEPFMAGHGGTGGGGTMAIRAGGDLLVAGTLFARGGNGPLINGDNPNSSGGNGLYGLSSPGGGGSGGSFLLQSNRSVAVSGAIDTSGGRGGRVESAFVTNPLQKLDARAGDGAPGSYRLEAPTVQGGAANVPAFASSVHQGTLDDVDAVSGDLSTWRASGSYLPVNWLYYELDVDIDGDGVVDITYTDSGAAGTQIAFEPQGPVTLPVVARFQGARVDPYTGEVTPGSVGPWRAGVGLGAGPGIAQDAATGYRFELLYNRALFPDVVVRALRVVVQ